MIELTLLDLISLLGNSFIFPFSLIVSFFAIFSKCSWPEGYTKITQIFAISLIALAVLLRTEMIIFFVIPGMEIIAAVLFWLELLVSLYLVFALFLGRSRGPKILLVSVRIIGVLLCVLLIPNQLIPMIYQLPTVQ